MATAQGAGAVKQRRGITKHLEMPHIPSAAAGNCLVLHVNEGQLRRALGTFLHLQQKMGISSPTQTCATQTALLCFPCQPPTVQFSCSQESLIKEQTMARQMCLHVISV